MRRLFAVLVAGLAACGDGGTGPVVMPETLSGRWVARPGCLPACGFTFTPVANPGDSLNVVQAYGITMDLEITPQGRIRLDALGGPAMDPVRGTVTVEGSTLLLRDGATVDTVDFQVVDGRLRLDFREQVLLVDAPSTVRGVFQRP